MTTFCRWGSWNLDHTGFFLMRLYFCVQIVWLFAVVLLSPVGVKLSFDGELVLYME